LARSKRDRVFYRAWKSGWSYQQIADAARISKSEVARRVKRFQGPVCVLLALLGFLGNGDGLHRFQGRACRAPGMVRLDARRRSQLARKSKERGDSN